MHVIAAYRVLQQKKYRKQGSQSSDEECMLFLFPVFFKQDNINKKAVLTEKTSCFHMHNRNDNHTVMTSL